MTMMREVFGIEDTTHRVRESFFRWQCRVRQIAMREMQGRPDAGMTASVTLDGEKEPLGDIITLINKAPAYSKTPEFKHMFLQTNDPAQRRDKALQLLSETYYQKHREFSDMLTATFLPQSPGARTMLEAKRCRLVFEAYTQRYELACQVRQLGSGEPLYQATWWHNLLFNPNLSPDTIILGFQPKWESSLADNVPAGG